MKSIIFSAVLMMIVSFCRAQVVLKSDSCQVPSMMFGDTIRTGQPFSKDPHVISFHGKYLMYYSIAPSKIRDGE